MVIERNRVWRCNIGIELASEHKGRSTSHITVRNNLIKNNQIGGIFLGGYNKNRGLTEHCLISNNTLYRNDTRDDGNGELYLQFGTRNNTIINNIFVSNQNLIIGNPYTENESNQVDYNLYYYRRGQKASAFQWKKQRYWGWSAYRYQTGNDKHSIFASPGLNENLVIQAYSPCIDAGDPSREIAEAEVDLNGAPRQVGDAVDLGAFELQGP